MKPQSAFNFDSKEPARIGAIIVTVAAGVVCLASDCDPYVTQATPFVLCGIYLGLLLFG